MTDAQMNRHVAWLANAEEFVVQQSTPHAG